MESAKSDFEVQVVRIPQVVSHPNADTLDLVNIFGATAIIKRGILKTGDLAVYVPVDAMVPTNRSEFAFLSKEGKSHARIKAVKLRGIFSMGLVVPVPKVILGVDFGQHYPGEGSDMAAAMGIERYVAPADRVSLSEGGNPNKVKSRAASKGPKLPVYGLDPLRKYAATLPEGTDVVVTSKIHGTNARFVSTGGRLWVGSHKMMRGCSRSRFGEFVSKAWLGLKNLLGIKHRAHLLQSMGDVWWQIAEKYQLQKRLAGSPDMVLFGEIYGRHKEGGYVQAEAGVGFGYDTEPFENAVIVNGIKTGATETVVPGIRFRAFDVFDLKLQRFLDWDDFQDFLGRLNEEEGRTIMTVPVLDRGPWSAEMDERHRKYADAGKNPLTSKHIGEGVVIKPAKELHDNRCGRVALKYAGQQYLLLRGKEG